MSVQRPMSPHLQVYRPQLTTTLSILHRLTGLFLCLGAIALIAWVWLIAAGPDGYLSFVAFAKSWMGKLLAATSVFALMFHLGNGIRHLFWDAGKGFSLVSTYRSGYAVIAFATLGTAGVLLMLRGAA